MCQRFFRRGAVLCSVAAAVLAFLTPACGQTVSIQGSTTFNSRILVPYQAQIEAAAKQKLSVVANKSSLGLVALLEGHADLAMISAPLDGEVAFLRKSRPDLPYERLRIFEISRTHIAFAVHPSNPVRSIDRKTMKRVLLGEIKNWRELGGPDLPIRIAMVRDGGGVQTSVESELLAGQHIQAENPIRAYISSQVVKLVEQEPGGLGLCQFGVLKKTSVPELVLDKPVVQVLNLVTLDQPKASIQAVIDSTLQIAAKGLD